MLHQRTPPPARPSGRRQQRDNRAVAFRSLVVTVSDGVVAGTRPDRSGDSAEAMLREAGFDVGSRVVVGDDRKEIESVLRRLAGEADLVVTTGGTGFGPRDVTPEATRAVIDREAPGLAELMRRAGMAHTPMAALSRAAVADTPAVIASREPAVRTYAHELGTVEVFLDPRPGPPTMVVVSATPVALELLRLARALGFRNALVEPRTQQVTADHRAAADSVHERIDEVALGPDTDVVHTDHDAPGVAESVAAALRSPARFLGVMGSRRHVGPHVEALQATGSSDEHRARVRTPVGIDLGARTPE